MTRAVLVVAAVLALGAGASAQRLPSGTTPDNYKLKFTPDLVKATFAAEASIRVKLGAATTTIVLNAAEIEFQKVTVTANGITQTATVILDDKKEQASFTVASRMPAGTALIRASYTGILNSDLRGFYLSQTKRRRYAVTQFEATDARRAFPSFDEPAAKATYDITLVIDKGDTAISNSSILSDTPGPGTCPRIAHSAALAAAVR